MNDLDNDQKAAEKRQISSLRSGNRVSILGTLKEIRSAGRVSILPEVFDLLVNQEDEQIYHESISLLNDLKNQEAVMYLVEALRNKDYESIRKDLVSSCWQSGLNYSQFTGLFIDLALHDSYETALEAFTVIEDSLGELEPADLIKHTDYLRAKISGTDTNKQLLLKELIRVMESY